MTMFPGFSSESFEQLIRALAVRVFGPGVTVLGNGPDGGREAAFRGRVHYPYPPAQHWEGYGVIQAKFKQRLEDTQREQKWAADQLRTELKKWRSNPNRSPKPDYFVFCTNVELSSGHNGGREILEAVFAEFSDDIGLKDFAIWDANQLKGYVDTYPEIRTRFNDLFTTGDLIAQLAKASPKVADPETILTLFLSRELRSDEDARLSQAGDRSEDRIRLAEVFVDLPSSEDSDDVELDGDINQPLPAGSLKKLSRVAAHKLDSMALSEVQHGSDDEANRLFGRYIFIGGPGSGKSTIGQFLAQIHRAALLGRRPPHRLESRVREIIESIGARCKELKVAWPSTPRLPIRIELNAFAKALQPPSKESSTAASKGVSSLSEYLRRSLSSDVQVSHADLREWLKAFPWLLVIDGLDEVPSSSNRKQVISAIQSFLAEIRDIEADVLIVASSRPDGYEGEFDGEDVKKLHLIPLSKRRAIACAERYIRAKSAAKGDSRTESAFGTIKDATENPLIAKLMTTPLQVTFMVTVVAASGKPSESRWQLFSDYYRTIYERELHKAVRPFDRVLSQRRQDIDALHHRVGFILQCRAELSGGTQSDLDISEFESMVDESLRENGLTGNALIEEREMLVGAAKLRLVFLVSRVPGRLSFDVRSLQEYMAAACITNADTADVIARLRLVAHSAYWRNTFIFAVGRFFVETRLRDHRGSVRLLCEDLNREEPIRSHAKLGSRVALEILESGVVGSVPLVKRSLAVCALELLADTRVRFDDVPRRLASVCDLEIEKEFSTAIEVWLGQSEFHKALRAWMTLLFLEEQSVPWASQMIQQWWPVDGKRSFGILQSWFRLRRMHRRGRRDGALGKEVLDRLTLLFPALSIAQSRDLAMSLRPRLLIETIDPPWLGRALRFLSGSDWFDAGVIDDEGSLIMTSVVVPIANEVCVLGAEAAREIRQMENAHQDWRDYAEVFDFIEKPCASQLARALECLARQSLVNRPLWLDLCQWPLTLCLAQCSDSLSLLAMAEAVRHGSLEDQEQWVSFESRWNHHGLSVAEFENGFASAGWSLVGAGPSLHLGSHALGNNVSFAESLLAGAERLVCSTHRDRILGALLRSVLSDKRMAPSLQDAMLDRILAARSRLDADGFWIEAEVLERNWTRWHAILDAVGRSPKLRYAEYLVELEDSSIEQLSRVFLAEPQRWGLLRLIAYWYAAGASVSNEVLDALRNAKCSPETLESVLLLKAGCSDAKEAIELGKLIQSFIRTSDDRQGTVRPLLRSIQGHGRSPVTLELILPVVEQELRENEIYLREQAAIVSLTILQALPSGFQGVRLRDMGLPVV